MYFGIFENLGIEYIGLEEGIKKYGKNADTVKNLKDEITKYQSQLDVLQGTKQKELTT